MSKPSLSARNLVFAAFIVGAVVASVELFLRRTADATFLVALTYTTAVVEGCVALAATGELAKGVWLVPIKRELYSVYPLLLVVALLSLLLGAKIEIYGWSERPNGWLNVRFFLARNFVVLFLTFLTARKLVTAVSRGSPHKNRYAAFYIALFIVSQSLVAFDWIMSLEYPWVSTLLGGYFFNESFLIGLAAATFILFFRMRDSSHRLTETLRDTAKMMFAFSVVWVGFFFAQFLVIWYGNIPEEVGYVFTRVKQPPYAGLSRAVLFSVWVIPFVVLLSRPLKTVAPVMAGVAALIAAGLFIEKLVLVLPVARVSPPALAIEVALLLSLVGLFIAGRDSIVPQRVTDTGGSEAGG